ncbi:MAG: ABC transporter ATP-binding protein [Anaerolineae bacterium]
MVNLEPALEARGIHHIYDDGQGPLPALEGVKIAVAHGEFVAIVGPSGCGKSTLLRILGGLLTPTEGDVYLEGERLATPRRRVAYVFQNINLMPWRTVLRNVTLPLEVARIPATEAAQRAQNLLLLVGLEGFEGAYPRQLSGGMAQRVAIARALVAEPDVLLLDEPFGSLDALSREQMNLELLRIWRARKVTAVMVTHDLREAIFLADRVLVMSPRPGAIQAEVVVDLPRPRTLEVIYTEFFGALSRRVREAVRTPRGRSPEFKS